MTFYIISDAGQIVENYHNRPTDEQLQKLADEMELCLYVIEGDHTGMEAYPAIVGAPDLQAENERLREGILAVVNLPDGYAVSEIKEMLAALINPASN